MKVGNPVTSWFKLSLGQELALTAAHERRHLWQAARQVNGRVLWANLHLLFWLSLIPFVTGWMGETHFAASPVAAYGTVLLFAGLAYYILSQALIRHHGKDSELAPALGRDVKGKVSVVLYVITIPFAFSMPLLACALYIVVAVLSLIPDRRLERRLAPRAS